MTTCEATIHLRLDQFSKRETTDSFGTRIRRRVIHHQYPRSRCVRRIRETPKTILYDVIGIVYDDTDCESAAWHPRFSKGSIVPSRFTETGQLYTGWLIVISLRVVLVGIGFRSTETVENNKAASLSLKACGRFLVPEVGLEPT